MDEVARLVARLLAALHRALPLPPCPGDWLWTAALAGAAFAVFPVAAAVLLSTVRKVSGNRYPTSLAAVFAAVGLAGGTVLPWLGFSAASRVLGGAGGVPLSSLGTFGSGCFVTDQSRYFAAGPDVSSALFDPGRGGTVLAIYVAALVGVPLLGLVFTALLFRAAFRRGPGWPARVFGWVPFVLLAVGTLGLPANPVVSLWLGYLPVLLVGALLVLLLGAPRWSVAQRRRAEPPAPEFLPEPEPEPAPPPERLADTPGPLPFPTGEPQPSAAPDVAEPAPDSAPDLGGRFRRIRTLGSGGFGTVWLAKDTHLGRTVAVKFAHAPDADTEQRMMREARALAAVAHPNCVQLYDVVTEGDGLGLVMEYIEGSGLSDAVRANGRLDDVAAARLWATMAGALDAAHQQGVLHRDVKPSNVIIDPEGTPHLIDFGIARSTGDQTLTRSGMMMGTPDFLAPETASGEGATPASDSWQLAATVSFALSGKPPRGGRDTPMAALMAAANAEPPHQLPPGSAHARLLAAALHSDPARRPTLAELRRQLTGWLAARGQDEQGPVATVVTAAVDPDGTSPAGRTRRPR